MFYNRYLRELFEPAKYHSDKYRNVKIENVADSFLLEIICELTGLSEPRVIEKACLEIQKHLPEFDWNFDNYFKNLRLKLHPLVKHELQQAYFTLHQ